MLRPISLLLLAFTFACRAVAQEVVPATERVLSVIRVNVTTQAYDFARPWGKRAPFSRRAIGAVLPGQRVLVTAEVVANANYVEFETGGGDRKVPAAVEFVDYEANLALLKTDDPEFLKLLKPLEITSAAVGDVLAVWQLEANGNLLVTTGPMTTAEVIRYPIDESSFLAYRLTTQLQFRESSSSLPVVKDDKLVGIIQRYENTSNNADIIPAPVIQHFLADAGKTPYEGFPRAGMTFSATRDPQLRRFAGLPGATPGGVFVTDVLKASPAEKAGIQKGDVILQIDGQAVDQDGNYKDPQYGKIAVTHLLGARHFHGDRIKVSLMRKGQLSELELTLLHRPREEAVIEPYVIDRGPKFYIVGGLVLQELSRQYLKEWGSDWLKKAPEQFVYFDRMQNELFKNGPEKLVILSRVLPSATTVGYEDLAQLVVTKINGMPLKRLADVPTALAKAKNGLHQIDFDGDPTTIYLDAQQVVADEKALSRKYRLPELSRLD
jgi:S1-C subfamily serine protease